MFLIATIGLGAQSFSHHTLQYNLGAATKGLHQYMKSLELNRLPVQDLYHLSREAAMGKMASGFFLSCLVLLAPPLLSLPSPFETAPVHQKFGFPFKICRENGFKYSSSPSFSPFSPFSLSLSFAFPLSSPLSRSCEGKNGFRYIFPPLLPYFSPFTFPLSILIFPE